MSEPGGMGEVADWLKAAGAVTTVLTAIGGFGWKFLKQHIHAEAGAIQKKLEQRMTISEDRHAALEKRLEQKADSVTNSFGETIHALRQKINDVELASERTFMPKADFADFRKEYRVDMKRIDDKLDVLTKRNSP